mgnify:FL=1
MTTMNIGTSGFMISQKVWFSFLCLNCIEINSTFYRLPSEKSIENWNNFPENVSIVLKVSKYITHTKRLKNAKEGWDLFWEKISPLKNLSALLFQLPPSFAFKEEYMQRIETMHSYLPKNINIVFEFRDISWFREEVYERFKKLNWCISGTFIQKKEGGKWMGTMPPGLNLPPKTASFNYIRVHGARGYKGRIDEEQLTSISTALKAQVPSHSYTMFNNTFFTKKNDYCLINNKEIKYAAVCNAAEFSKII